MLEHQLVHKQAASCCLQSSAELPCDRSRHGGTHSHAWDAQLQPYQQAASVNKDCLPLSAPCLCAACAPAHRNLLSDLAYTSQADVLLGLHGDTLYWSFFMTQHSSVVEIRPRGFAGPQADRHLKVGVQLLLLCCLSLYPLRL